MSRHSEILLFINLGELQHVSAAELSLLLCMLKSEMLRLPEWPE